MWGAIIAAAISAVASGIGTAVANKRKREAEEKYAQQQQGLINDIDNELNSNYLDRADSRNAIRKVTESNKEALRQLNTDAIRSGATDEAKVAMASQLNKRTADVVGDIAAIGEQHKDSLRRDRRSLLAGKALHEYQVGSDTSGIDRVIQGVGSAANAIGAGIDGKSTPESKGPTDDVTAQAVIPELSPAASKAVYGAKKAVDAGDPWATKVGGVISNVTPDMGAVNDDFLDGLLNRDKTIKYGQTM